MTVSVKVVTDSTSYLPTELRESLGIAVVSLEVNFADGSYAEENVENAWFYAKMAGASEVPTSSQPNVADLVRAFQEPVALGQAVVGVFLSAAMSGTCETARMARSMVLERHPDAKIAIVDSRSNCMQLGFAAIAAARAANDGGTLEQCAAAARETRRRTRFLFVPETLDYLRKGGRIGGASALLGGLLQIRPVLTVDGGVTEVWGKVRTKRRALLAILEALQRDADQYGLADAVVHHIDNEAEGREVTALLEPILGRPVRLVALGPVIGLHVGPGTVGVVWETRDPLRDAETQEVDQ